MGCGSGAGAGAAGAAGAGARLLDELPELDELDDPLELFDLLVEPVLPEPPVALEDVLGLADAAALADGDAEPLGVAAGAEGVAVPAATTVALELPEVVAAMMPAAHPRPRTADAAATSSTARRWRFGFMLSSVVIVVPSCLRTPGVYVFHL